MNANHEAEEAVKIEPGARFDIEAAADMLERVRASSGGVEFDLSAVEHIDVAALQFILVVVDSKRQQQQPVVMRDSESGVLREALELLGIQAERAGLSARFNLGGPDMASKVGT